MTDDKNLYAVADRTPEPDSLVLLDMVEIQMFTSGDIVSIVPFNQMQSSLDDFTCGSLEFEGELIPVFYLNRHLQLQPAADSRCAALAILSTGTQRFGVACLGIQKYEAALPAFYSVPVCMSSRKQPFNEFAVVNQKAVGLTSAAELLRVLRLRGAALANPQSAQRLGALQ